MVRAPVARVRQVLLLRGVNLGPSRRIAMADLRGALASGGFEDPRTYVQSGNVVVTSEVAQEELVRRCERLLEERFGLQVTVVARTRSELAEVVERNPLREVAVDPKRHQVTFLGGAPPLGTLGALEALAGPGERVVVLGREIYSWHPAGLARSRLALAVVGRTLGTTATARNWTTVTTLLAMASEP